jgi:hypothetical protein
LNIRPDSQTIGNDRSTLVSNVQGSDRMPIFVHIDTCYYDSFITQLL